MNAFLPALFAQSIGCLPCCPQPSGCACALEIPVFSSPYADYATAATAIADQTSNCIGYADGSPDSFTADNSTPDQIDLDADYTADGIASGGMVVSVSVPVGATISIAYNVSSTGTGDDNNVAGFTIQGCDASGICTDEVESGGTGPVSGTFTCGPFAEEGVYYITVSGRGQNTDDPDESTTATLDFSISCDDTMIAQPVIALWDDSGTTRSLWACPKLLLPPLTESTGDWYSSCEAADVEIAAGSVDCLAFNTLLFNQFTSQSFSGTSYSASNGNTEEPTAFGDVWFNVNLVGGDTVTISCAVSGSGTTGCDPGNPSNCSLAEAEITLYHLDGTILLHAIDTQPGAVAASASDNIAVPYTGQYLAKATAQAGSWDTESQAGGSGSASVTSSGDISSNPIQALYDIGLDCPARLNCGDSCP